MEALSGLEGILILTDIAGGSPFNVSLKLKLTRTEAIEVIGGTNLPVLLEAYLSRAMYEGAGTPPDSTPQRRTNHRMDCGREMWRDWPMRPAKQEKASWLSMCLPWMMGKTNLKSKRQEEKV